jgi:signal peptidase I
MSGAPTTRPADRRAAAHRVGSVLLTITALLGSLCIAATVGAAALDLRPLVFRSGSMSPAIDTGALAIARTTDVADVRVGDVVSVTASDGSRITHRVQRLESSGTEVTLVLKGDANAAEDAEIYRVGTVDRVILDVPRLGRAVAWAAGPGGRAAGLLVVAAALLVVIWSAGGGDRGGARRATVLLVVLTLGAGFATRAGPTTTLASFTDAATTTTGALASGSVTKPAAVGCSVNNPLVGTKSLTTTWAAASSPAALTYTAKLVYPTELGGAQEVGLSVQGSGSERSVTVTGNLLDSLLGSSFRIDVTAALPGTSWTATSSRAGTLVLLGLGFTCGAWS